MITEEIRAVLKVAGCEGILELLEEYELAQFIHAEYEKSAAAAGWTTQKTCQVDFDNLPGANKVTMLKVADAIRQKYIKNAF